MMASAVRPSPVFHEFRSSRERGQLPAPVLSLWKHLFRAFRVGASGSLLALSILFITGTALAQSGGPTITSVSPLPDGVQGDAYGTTLAATGGTLPYVWSVSSGQLPAGLSLDPADGTISGAPSAVESQTFIVAVTDADNSSSSAEFTLRVLAPLQVTTLALPNGTVGTAFDQTVEASGGATPYVWSVSSGTVPSGLTLDPATGRLSGTPDASGVSDFMLVVTDADGHTASNGFEITIAEAPAITTTSLPNATAGIAYSSGVSASGGTAPLAWSLSAGALPAGLTLDPGAGTITGTPGIVGTSNFTIQVTDAVGAADSRAFSISVSSGTAAALAFVQQPSSVHMRSVITPAVTVRVTDALTNPVPNVTVTLALSGGAPLAGGTSAISNAQGIATFNSLTVGEPGTGLRLEATAGVLGPVQSAPFDVTCPVLTIAPGSLPLASVGVAYLQTLVAAGGVSPYSYSINLGALPAGLTLDGATGQLSGTPSSSGTFPFTAGATDSVGCSAARAETLVVLALPAAIADLASSQSLSGNDVSGRLRLAITFTPPSGASSIEVYRAPFGHYPEYDDAGGATPSEPSYPPPAPWEITAVTGSGQVDQLSSRDVWFYVAFSRNTAGGISVPSNLTTGTPDYLLGDVSNGVTPGTGNNRVAAEDISLLGAHYGIGASQIAAQNLAFLDVGPTVDLSPTSRPFTDGQINFEDLILFAQNYGVVTAPSLAAKPARTLEAAGGAVERFNLSAPSLVEPGTEVEAILNLSAAGHLQGFSAHLSWDAAVVEPQGIEPLGYLAAQGGLVLSSGPGIIDAALLGVRASGMSGAGEVARVRFRVLRSGVSRIALAGVDGRDATNHRVSALEATTEVEVPGETVLLSPAPNPTHGSATLSYTLARSAVVELGIYGVDGRRLRTLSAGEQKAGVHRLEWDGRDGGGRALAAGVYYLHLSVGGRRQTRTLVLVR